MDEIKTLRVIFVDGEIYSCHITSWNETDRYLIVTEWYAKGCKRDVYITLDKIKYFSVE